MSAGQAVRVLEPVYGEPTLAQANHGKATWIRGSTSPLDQKSPTGWLACLDGGVQSGDDWARVNIPVYEVRVADFSKTRRTMWSYYMTATETMGVNIVIWMHDPNNFDNRAEITQLGGHADLTKTSGWNAFSFSRSTGGMFYYGEGTTGTALTAGTQYTWAQFQDDVEFCNWTIYRITIEYGWEASGTFDPVYVADLILDGVPILLRPAGQFYSKQVIVTKTLECEGGYSAEDVMSESDTGNAGTDWDIDFGGKGYITKALVHHPTTALSARVAMQLYNSPPTCELDDNAASTGPVAADVPYFEGDIVFSALKDYGTGGSYSVATSNTPASNLPFHFNSSMLYGVALTLDATDPGDDTLLTFIFDAEMEVN